MKMTNSSIFQNFAASQQNSEQRRLKKSWVNERCIIQSFAQVKRSANEHDLRERQCIDKRQTMVCDTDVFLGQEHRLVHDEEPKDQHRARSGKTPLSHDRPSALGFGSTHSCPLLPSSAADVVFWVHFRSVLGLLDSYGRSGTRIQSPYPVPNTFQMMIDDSRFPCAHAKLQFCSASHK